MIGRHTYKHLDSDSKVEISLDLKEVVDKVMSMNYGVQRFLSHLVDARQKEHAERIASYMKKGQYDTAKRVSEKGDELADGIEKLLNEGLF